MSEPAGPGARLRDNDCTGGKGYEENRRNDPAGDTVPAGRELRFGGERAGGPRRAVRRLYRRRRAPVPARQGGAHQYEARERHRGHRRLSRAVHRRERGARHPGPLHDRPGKLPGEPRGPGRVRRLPGGRGYRVLCDPFRQAKADSTGPGGHEGSRGLRRGRSHRAAVPVRRGPGGPAGGPGRRHAVCAGDGPVRDLYRLRARRKRAGRQLRGIPDRRRRAVPEERFQLHLRADRFGRDRLRPDGGHGILPDQHRRRPAPEGLRSHGADPADRADPRRARGGPADRQRAHAVHADVG